MTLTALMADAQTAIRDVPFPLDAAERRRQLVRVVAASAAGTTIEWYDFFLYGAAAATVFPQKFFPGSDPFIGTLLSFSTFFVGFVVRPVGAALFGHFGGRIGRKALLVITMMMMGIATVGIGLIPSYEVIGIWGAVLLTIGRVLQGLSLGGEWSGSVLMAGEWADPKHRGFTTSFAQFGAPAGTVLANGALALMTLVTSEAQFLEWGWRVPFLASIVLVFVGLYIRVGVLETPVFSQLKARGAVQKAPLVEVVRRNWREIVLTALLRTGQQVQFIIFTTYIITYATQQLGMSRGTILNFVMLQALLSLVTVVYMGHLSDRFGRRRVTAIGCGIMLVYPFIYFRLLDTQATALVFLAALIAMPLHDLQYGPQAAFISESFPGSLRYSGSSPSATSSPRSPQAGRRRSSPAALPAVRHFDGRGSVYGRLFADKPDLCGGAARSHRHVGSSLAGSWPEPLGFIARGRGSALFGAALGSHETLALSSQAQHRADFPGGQKDC